MTDHAGFAATARAEVEPWLAAILAHPFLRGLATGTLPEATFARYLLDDAHYLVGYARALASLAARVEAPAAATLLAHAAAGALEAERGLHRAFLLPRGIDPDAPDAAEATPTCRGYVDRLQTLAAFAPVEVGTAAVLPCFRVYADVGQAIRDEVGDAADHPYRAWVQTYGGADFAAAVRAAEALTDELAATTTAARREAMAAAYRASTRDEWRFWDAAWRGETWPTPAL